MPSFSRSSARSASKASRALCSTMKISPREFLPTAKSKRKVQLPGSFDCSLISVRYLFSGMLASGMFFSANAGKTREKQRDRARTTENNRFIKERLLKMKYLQEVYLYIIHQNAYFCKGWRLWSRGYWAIHLTELP